MGRLTKQNANVKELFEVRPDGEIVLLKMLDYEQQKQLQIPVEVSDGELKDSASVEVTVLDVNDEYPSFKLNPKDLQVPEHDDPGKVIGQIIDRDSEIVNGQVKCWEPADKAGTQVIEFSPDPRLKPQQSKFDLKTRQSFDREKPANDRFFVYLICSDGNNALNLVQLTSTVTLTLSILDINDHGPKFVQDQYDMKIFEGNAIGQKLRQIDVTDEDSGPNGQLTYTLNEQKEFRADSVTGTIIANRVFDRESQEFYQLTLTVSDHGIPPRTASAQINVRILDKNDNKPVFLPCENNLPDNMVQKVRVITPFNVEERSTNSFEIQENLRPHTFVGQVVATDADIGENADLRYELINDISSRHFLLNSNGSLFTTVSLDREQIAEFKLSVVAKDVSYNPLSSTGTVCITVTDENDHSPKIIKPSQVYPLGAEHQLSQLPWNGHESVSQNDALPRKVIQVSWREEPNSVVIKVAANDSDVGDNAKILFKMQRIAGQMYIHDTDFLGIEPDTGYVRITRAMRIEELGEHKFNVTAIDQGKPPRSSSVLMMIELTDTEPIGDIDTETSTFIKRESDDQKWWENQTNLVFVIILGGVTVALTIVLILAIICFVKPYWCMQRVSSNCHDSPLPMDRYHTVTGYTFVPGMAMDSTQTETIFQADPQSNVPGTYATFHSNQGTTERSSFIPTGAMLQNHAEQTVSPLNDANYKFCLFTASETDKRKQPLENESTSFLLIPASIDSMTVDSGISNLDSNSQSMSALPHLIPWEVTTG
ncbi:hypothetical protein Ciccas_001466 [Cichlidogyrus casuarinus]|uniref:Cadherin domain-containing protein n=1 Tax=Cichlidogyrus casuarinus TaxID=1844966 RepID=A0ABD2QL37_9PLAT